MSRESSVRNDPSSRESSVRNDPSSRESSVRNDPSSRESSVRNDPSSRESSVRNDPSSWENPSARERRRILRETRRVAMVGASPNPARASNFVATYLLDASDYELWFVNPNAEEILGRPVYPSLADLPGVPDLVDTFRRPQDLPGVLDEVLGIDGVQTWWLQFGLWDTALAARAEAAGITVVMDRCLKVEHARFAGGLHLAGFDTGVISARRRAR
jgi:predicted CoA-binding protein